MSRPLVLQVGPGKETRGGVTTVISNIVTSALTNETDFVWVETHQSGRKLLKIWKAFRALYLFIRLLPRSDIVHFHVSEPISAWRKLPFVLVARLFRVPIISHLHAFSVASTIHGRFGGVYRYIFKRSRAVIVISDYWLREIDGFLGSEGRRSKLVYNPCPVPSVSALHGEGRPPYILFSGTLTPRKGYADLLEAFARVDTCVRDGWKLVFLGDGDLERAMEVAEDLGISDHVVLAGWISGETKELWYAGASLFCLPSYAEGLPMSVLEAVGYGLPVIFCPVGGLIDWVGDEYPGISVECGDVAALSTVLDRLISSKSDRERQRVKSLRLAAGTHSFAAFEENLQAVYDSVLEVRS